MSLLECGVAFGKDAADPRLIETRNSRGSNVGKEDFPSPIDDPLSANLPDLHAAPGVQQDSDLVPGANTVVDCNRLRACFGWQNEGKKQQRENSKERLWLISDHRKHHRSGGGFVGQFSRSCSGLSARYLLAPMASRPTIRGERLWHEDSVRCDWTVIPDDVVGNS